MRPQPPQPRARRGSLHRTALMAGEPPLVDLLRDKRAHVRVHPSGHRQEYAPIIRDGHVGAQHVLQHARPRPTRVDRQRNLGQLQRVPQQHHIAGRPRRRHRVGQRHLPGLVHHQHVHRSPGQLLAREQPRRPRRHVELCPSTRLIRAHHVGHPRQLDRRHLLYLADGPKPIQIPRLLEHLHHRRHQVLDRRMAHGGNPHPLPCQDQAADQVRAPIRLPRPRRTLDGHKAVVQVTHPLDHLG